LAGGRSGYDLTLSSHFFYGFPARKDVFQK
jgi:hypothetical protein